MWVLDVVAGDNKCSNTTFYLVAGEWSIGRKHCHFNFHADTSISRTHALIRVGALTFEQLEDPSTRPVLELVDMNSRFGSFVNQEQCLDTRRLRHGDQISFGAKKIVLRVRYQVFVLVASRIHRANRPQVNDTCQRIGMHLLGTETKDATHCIMDPGRIVATVKVLWALVFNQPVVCTPWIYAILNRSSLSEPLPRCEEFLPSDPSIPSMESNYLPNPLRKTLFLGYAVVFLTPQSMQELIPAMGGVVLAAYQGYKEDNNLLRELESLASSKRLLLVEPQKGAEFSSTARQSEQRASAVDDHAFPLAIAERRVDLLKSMGAVFTSVQELAASVIFVKTPTALNDSVFSSHAGSSIHVMSFPEHLSLRSTLTAEHEDQEIQLNQEEQGADYKENNVADAMIKKDSEHLTDPHYNSAEVKGGAFEDPDINIVQVPDMGTQEQDEASSSPGMSERVMMPEKSKDMDLSAWKSSRVLRHDVKPEQQGDFGKPVVVSCELIVKKRELSGQGKKREPGLVNYKRFKKGNGYKSRSSTASLFPQQTILSVVDNADRVALQENLETMEEQERIAEELFAMGEGRTKTKLF
ncbi:unnamed protein product [Peronospora farinosa]|uniref:FHA domain-containing protein n=1 Tax=Peronospora farinosa TaxID=134698 RepID=A0AAV0U2T9_9STRA|nr:unnamed protein product [Peronospora farinosa]CAI5730693.1 unnamed protein product [Peronospora farinosa]